MRDVLRDLGLIERLDFRQVAAADDALRNELPRLRRAVFRVLAEHQVVADATAVTGPVLVERRDREQVGDVDLGHEVASRGGERLELGDRVSVQRRLAVGIHRRGHAADQEALQVRVLAAEHGVHLDELALPVERLEIVRDGHQVRFRRQSIGRMAPVGVGKRPQLSAVDERLDAIANPGEVLGTRQRPVRDRLGERRGLRRVGRQVPRRCRPSRARADGRSGRRGPGRTAPP